MFNNIGKKIKILAKVIMWILIAGCIITVMVLPSIDDDLVVIGLLILFGGPVVAWISCWFMYAFGQLVENSDKLVKASDDGNLKGIKTSNVFNEQKSVDYMTKENTYDNTFPNNSNKSMAFGQLVENSDKLVKASNDGDFKGIRTSNVFNEQKSVDYMTKENTYGNTFPNNSNKSMAYDTNVSIVEKTTEAVIECPNCHQRQSKSRRSCFKCGTRFINKNVVTVPYWCNKCGKAGPFEENCPECGSSSRVYR